MAERLDATDLDALRTRLEAHIALSTSEYVHEQAHGNEYSVATSKAAHSTLMFLVKTYIDPLWSALMTARAEAVGVATPVADDVESET